MMSYTIRPIRNEEEYTSATEELIRIMDAEDGSQEADTRDVLALLIENYEEENYPIPAPDPISAIKFRMSQAELTQKDLIPYIGSRSKVSEILSGKRELNIKMARALHLQLGIPADSLLSYPGISLSEEPQIDFERFPVQEMKNYAVFQDFEFRASIKDHVEEMGSWLIKKIGGPNAVPQGLFRSTGSSRLSAKMNSDALQAWCLLVLASAKNARNVKSYHKEALTEEFINGLVRLSAVPELGPVMAVKYLADHGITVVHVRPLKRTYIDGAAFMTTDGRPVIGLTLRYDRVDNFWFVLLHEVGHIAKHLSGGTYIADDMSLRDRKGDSEIEKEADEYAEKAFFPNGLALANQTFISTEEVLSFAELNHIHPAIVAGRIRHQKKNFRLFSKLTGQGDIRRLFQ